MDEFEVPSLLKDSFPVLTDSDGQTIALYHQDQEIEQANVRLSKNLIVFVLRGRKKVLGEQQNITIKKGHGFFLRKGNYLLSEKFGNKEYYKSLLFFFSDEFAHQFTSAYSVNNNISSDENNTHKTLGANTAIHTFLKNLQSYFEDSELLGQSKLASLKLRELFLLLVKSDNNTGFTDFLKTLNKSPKYQFREFMNLHYKENLSLEQYAFLTGLSLSTFKRRFEEEFDTTPGRWIKEKQLQEAKFLLRTKQQNVSQVCFEVGFENLSHFIQAFKKKYGITPKQFQIEHHTTKSES